MGDISLILGTVLSQLSIGTFVTVFVLAYLLKKVEPSTAFRAYIVSFAAGVIGLGAMILHLGHPLLAFNAFFNLGSSWLSREVLFYGGYLGLNFLVLVFGKLNKENLMKPLGILASLAGICAVFVTSMIYTIPSIPAWNSANTPVSFILTALLLGVSLAIFVTKVDEGKAGAARVISAAAIVALAVTVVYVTTLLAGVPAGAGSAYLMMENAVFWVRLALLAVTGIGAGYLAYKEAKGKDFSLGVFGVFFALLVVSEFMGRFLFFETIVRL